MAEHKQDWTDWVEDRAGVKFLKHFGLEQYSKTFHGILDLCDLERLKGMDVDEIVDLARGQGIKKESDLIKFMKAWMALKKGEYIGRDCIPVKYLDLKPSKYHKLGSLAVAVTDESDFDNKVINASQMAIDMQKQFSDMDVHAAMTKLAMCGVLLQNAARDGINCNKHVAVLLDEHAKMVKDSSIASSSFVGSSLTVLQYHKLALVLANKGKSAAEALTSLAKCAEVAKEMSKVAKGLTSRACELTRHANTAKSSKIEEKTSLKDKIMQLKADIAAGREKRKKLKEEMGEIGSDEEEYAKYERRRENNRNIRNTKIELAGVSVRKRSLNKAIKTLEIVIEHCEQIALIFDKTRAYWKEMEKKNHKNISCHDSMKSVHVSDAEEIGMVIEEIEKSALNSFVLGRIYYKAKKEIVGALLGNLQVGFGSKRGEKENDIMQSYS